MVNTTSVRIEGNHFIGQRFIGDAHRILGLLRSDMGKNNLTIGRRVCELGDSNRRGAVTIVATSVHGQHTAIIYTDYLAKKENKVEKEKIPFKGKFIFVITFASATSIPTKRLWVAFNDPGLFGEDDSPTLHSTQTKDIVVFTTAHLNVWTDFWKGGYELNYNCTSYTLKGEEIIPEEVLADGTIIPEHKIPYRQKFVLRHQTRELFYSLNNSIQAQESLFTYPDTDNENGADKIYAYTEIPAQMSDNSNDWVEATLAIKEHRLLKEDGIVKFTTLQSASIKVKNYDTRNSNDVSIYPTSNKNNYDWAEQRIREWTDEYIILTGYAVKYNDPFHFHKRDYDWLKSIFPLLTVKINLNNFTAALYSWPHGATAYGTQSYEYTPSTNKVKLQSSAGAYNLGKGPDNIINTNTLSPNTAGYGTAFERDSTEAPYTYPVKLNGWHEYYWETGVWGTAPYGGQWKSYIRGEEFFNFDARYLAYNYCIFTYPYIFINHGWEIDTTDYATFLPTQLSLTEHSGAPYTHCGEGIGNEVGWYSEGCWYGFTSDGTNYTFGGRFIPVPLLIPENTTLSLSGGFDVIEYSSIPDQMYYDQHSKLGGMFTVSHNSQNNGMKVFTSLTQAEYDNWSYEDILTPARILSIVCDFYTLDDRQGGMNAVMQVFSRHGGYVETGNPFGNSQITAEYFVLNGVDRTKDIKKAIAAYIAEWIDDTVTEDDWQVSLITLR